MTDEGTLELLPERTAQAPIAFVSVPTDGFEAKELRRFLVAQLVVQLTGGESDPERFVTYAKAIDKFITSGTSW